MSRSVLFSRNAAALAARALRLVATGVLLTALAAVARPAAAQAGDEALVAKGDSIFKGLLGNGLCHTCHGPKGKGMKGLGPDLTDGVWLHGNGSADFVQQLVRTGVPAPKKSPTIMPPFGGMPLTTEQVTAVTAYVLSLRAKPQGK
ncbi:MAG: c-type cytochrome [Gemmatimonadota bacterium]|nr:c-type cytochrome [Gemmatimonadota bacterium]